MAGYTVTERVLVALAAVAVLVLVLGVYLIAGSTNYESCVTKAGVEHKSTDNCSRWNPFSQP